MSFDPLLSYSRMNGAPRWNRTTDLFLIREAFYTAELLVHGAVSEARTRNLHFTKVLRCQLC